MIRMQTLISWMKKKKYEKEKEQKFQQLKTEQDKLRLVKQKFQEIDSDGSKAIDIEEWLKMGKDVFPQINEQLLRMIFRKIDVSDSKEISFAEFDSWISKIGGIDKVTEQSVLDTSNEKKSNLSNDNVSAETNNDPNAATDEQNPTED